MGYALAEAALRRGARVLLVSGPTELKPPGAAEVTWVESAEEMRASALGYLPQSTIVIMTAAVSDYRPKHQAPQKIKRKGPMILELEPSTDILRGNWCVENRLKLSLALPPKRKTLWRMRARNWFPNHLTPS